MTSENLNWKEDAELLLQSNPHRDVDKEFGEETKTRKILLYQLLLNEEFERAEWLINNRANVNELQHPFTDEDCDYPILLTILLGKAFDKRQDRTKCLDFIIGHGRC